jgi:hypothetical protein
MSALAMRSVFLSLFIASTALAQATPDRVSGSGYFRLAARPDWQGGNGHLGLWNLYGRLMNEGSYAILELKLDVLQAPPDSTDLWASVHARLEGGTVGGADPLNGSLAAFRLSQLYVRAGNVLFSNVTWRIGTLWYYFGDLGLYDMRPASVLENAMGVSAWYHGSVLDMMVGVGDSGFSIRGLNYSPMPTLGGMIRLHPGSHFELGVGGDVEYEPSIVGDRYSPYQTPGVSYEDFVRHEVALNWVQAHPGQELLFPKPLPAAPDVPFRVVGYLGFGKLGPLQWDNLFVSFRRLPTQTSYVETYQGRDYTIYTADLTRDRTQLQIGNEMQLRLVPDRFDIAWALLYGIDSDPANTIQASEANRTYMSTVLRMQIYLTRSLHILIEGSMAQEISRNGNLWREHYDSIFESTDGISDSRGLQFGDTNVRNTFQLKGGLVLNPTGIGIYARPSLRLLYGAQYSSQQAAFGNGFSDSLSQFNQFPGTELHWHQLISLEAEGWY